MPRAIPWPPPTVTRRGKDYLKIRLAPQKYREVPLGPTGSPEARAEYLRTVAEMEAGVQQERKTDLAVMELAVKYADLCASESAKKRNRIKRSIALLCKLYGHTKARDFGPRSLATLQAAWAKEGLSRRYVKHLVDEVRLCFRWASEEELLPVEVWQSIRAKRNLRKGEGGVKESPKVRPVPRRVVEQTLPHLPPVIADMVRVQMMAGMRPGEVCAMRPADIDRKWLKVGRKWIWLYRMDEHKTDWRGGLRWVPIGPEAQKVLAPYLERDPEEYCFSPRESMQAFRQKQRASRRSKVQPSQTSRAKAQTKRRPGVRYRSEAYARRVAMVCEAHGIPHWSPNQLRHLVGTEVETEYGREDARCVLGHTNPSTSAIYCESVERAARVIAKIG